MQALIGGRVSEERVWMDGTEYNSGPLGSTIGNTCFYVQAGSHTYHRVNCDTLYDDTGPFAICEHNTCHPAIKSGRGLKHCTLFPIKKLWDVSDLGIKEYNTFSDPSCEAPAEYMFFPKTGKFYKPHFEEVMMIEALQTCHSEGGNLTVYRTEAEYDAVVAMRSKLT